MRMPSPVRIRLPARLFGHPLAHVPPTGGRREVRWRALDMIMRRLFGLVVHRPITLQYLSASHRTTVRLAPIVQMTSWRPQQTVEREVRNVAVRQIVRELVRSGGTRVTAGDRGADTAMAAPRAPVARRERPAAYPRLNVTMVRAPAAAAVREGGAARTTAASREAAAAGRAPRDVARSAPEPVSLAPQELSRVTDHVIRQLDRRVLSYRERTGRIL